MPIIKFEEIKLKAKKKYVCDCGKRLSKQTTIICTVNPFNKKADGVARNRTEVYEQAILQRDEWINRTETCTHKEAADASKN